MRLIIFLSVFFAASSSLAGNDEGLVPADGFFLPNGNAKAGKAAFNQLKCNACHWVENDLELPPPVSDQEGPFIGRKQAAYAAGWLANSIVSPSHVIARDSDGRSEGSDLSRMGDMTETMTVRQLIDIVAYIRSLDGSEP
ncbi:MAG: c-type cytochrome [Candidatus Omnitrophica bacterium]|nr:c-type cytochrome [Candidatus Omnitrophota bacterium]